MSLVHPGDLVIVIDQSSGFSGAHGTVLGFVSTYASPQRGVLSMATNKVQVQLENGGSTVLPVSSVRVYGQSMRPVGVQMTDLRGGQGVASFDPSAPMMQVTRVHSAFDYPMAPQGGPASALVWGYDPLSVREGQTVEEKIWENLQAQQHTIHPHVYGSSWLFSTYAEPVDLSAHLDPMGFDPDNPPPNLRSRYEQRRGLAPMGPPFPYY